MKYDKQDTKNRIRALRIAGNRWSDVVDALNREGYRTVSGLKFSRANLNWAVNNGAKASPPPPQPAAAPAPTTPTNDLRGAVLATLDFKIPADKRIELLRTILA